MHQFDFGDFDAEGLIDLLRKERDKLIQRLQLESAIFLCDKIIALKGMNPEDGLRLAHCIYLSKQYQRAAHIIQHNRLHENDVKCCILLAKCLMKIKKFKEALNCINACIKTNFEEKWKVPLLVLKGSAHEAIDNRVDAKNSFTQALESNFCCYEAFSAIARHHMTSKSEELDILFKSIQMSRSDETKTSLSFMIDFMIFFYYTQLKKYDKPDNLIVPDPFGIFSNNDDYLVALAERHFYNFELVQALDITTGIIGKDPHNYECLEIHISCLLALEKSIELFKLSQNLIDLYPEHEISWFALGCYYHLIKKKELSRRYLLKAVTLNNIFAPAWLLYGQSFSDDGEHDQVLAAYFKASHLMPGCHLPLLYIGVEYARTDNHKLGEKFMMKALSIAPEDPLVLHELSVTAFHSDELLKADRFLRQALKAVNYKPEKDSLDFQRFPVQFQPLFNNMGHILRKLGRNTEAIKYFQRSLSLLPNDPSTYSSIGLVYCMLDKYYEAVENLDNAYGLNRLFKRDDPTKELLEDALKYYPDNLKLFPRDLNKNCSKPLRWTDEEIEAQRKSVKNLISESTNNTNEGKNDENDRSWIMDDSSLNQSLRI